jgi:hypothetical protein
MATTGSGTLMYVLPSSPPHTTFYRQRKLTSIAERHNNQMDHPRHHVRPLHGMVRRRLHSRQTTLKKGLTAAGIPSRTSPLNLTRYLHTRLLTPSIVPHILLRAQTPRPSPTKPLHLLRPTTPLPSQPSALRTASRPARRTPAAVQ